MNIIKVIALSIIITLTGCAGMQPAKQTSIENVIDVPGRSKDQIYTATKIWIAENFNSAKAVIEDDDKAGGRIIGNGSVKYPCSGINCLGRDGWLLKFTMRVDTKDQKFKVTFTNIVLSVPSGTYRGFERALLQDEFDESQPVLADLSSKLRTAIEKEKTTANW